MFLILSPSTAKMTSRSSNMKPRSMARSNAMTGVRIVATSYGRLDREISAFLLGKPASVTSLVPLRTRIEAQRRAFLRAFEKAIGRYGQRGGAK
jgi:hypothetical protein